MEIEEHPTTPEGKYLLITRNLQEVLGEDIIRKVLQERNLRLYFGTAPTGRPHAGYFVPLAKIADFLRAGVEVTILLADIHAVLDNMKATWETISYRVKYYEFLIKAILRSCGVSIEKLRFVVGSDYQLSKKYSMDNFRMCSLVTERNARRAGAEVVKQVDSPLISGLMYPGMQALDEEHLGVDAQFGGLDQRKIFVLAQEYLPMLGYAKRAHLMNPMVPGLGGGKMSASLGADNKIDLLDDEDTVRKKIKRAFCEIGDIKNNPVLMFVKYVIFPVGHLKGSNTFIINRPDKHGPPLTYSSYELLENDFAKQKILPQDLKIGVTDALNVLLEPIRQEMKASPELREVVKNAYPETTTAKPIKKKKDRGTLYPGPKKTDSKKADVDTVAEQVENVTISK